MSKAAIPSLPSKNKQTHFSFSSIAALPANSLLMLPIGVEGLLYKTSTVPVVSHETPTVPSPK